MPYVTGLLRHSKPRCIRVTRRSAYSLRIRSTRYAVTSAWQVGGCESRLACLSVPPSLEDDQQAAPREQEGRGRGLRYAGGRDVESPRSRREWRRSRRRRRSGPRRVSRTPPRSGHSFAPPFAFASAVMSASRPVTKRRAAGLELQAVDHELEREIVAPGSRVEVGVETVLVDQLPVHLPERRRPDLSHTVRPVQARDCRRR